MGFVPLPTLRLLGAKKSRHLVEVVRVLKEDGYECEIKKVDYEFQKGGNQMLRVKSSNNGRQMTDDPTPI